MNNQAVKMIYKIKFYSADTVLEQSMGFVSKERAEAWLKGIEKNCKEYKVIEHKIFKA